MIFFDWRIAELLTVAVLMVAAGVWGLKASGKLWSWFPRLVEHGIDYDSHGSYRFVEE